MQIFYCQLHEVLLLRYFRMQPCSVVMPAPLTGASALVRVHRPRYVWNKVVVERSARMDRRGLLARLSAALRRLELAGHDAGDRDGRVYAASAYANVIYCVRVGWWY